MKSHIRRVFLSAEIRNERLSAYVRLASFAALVAVFGGLWLAGLIVPAQPIEVAVFASSLGGYGIVTALGIWLAEGRYFKPWVPWLFATTDVGFVLNILCWLVIAGDLPVIWALSAPGIALIFLFLAHAALRFRPWLVAYTAALFVVASFLLYAWKEAPAEVRPEAMIGMHLAAGEAMRILIVVLTTVVLAIAVRRTRRLLLTGIVEAHYKANLSRYLPPNLVDVLAREGPTVGEGGRRVDVAVLFADVRGFTALSENMDPSDVAAFLNEFRRRMSRPVFAHGGTLDKFIGDAMMAVFGAPRPGSNDAAQALACGRELVAEAVAWSGERGRRGLPPVALGVGIHYGPVIAGTLGDESRMEYTVVGDTVNAAQRIEQMTRDLGAPLLISAELLAAAGISETDGGWDEVPEQVVRGRTRPIRLFRQKPVAVAGTTQAGSISPQAR